MAKSKQKSGSDNYYKTIERLLKWEAKIGEKKNYDNPTIKLGTFTKLGAFTLSFIMDWITLYNNYYILRGSLVYIHKRYVGYSEAPRLDMLLEARHQHQVESVSQALREIDNRLRGLLPK